LSRLDKNGTFVVIATLFRPGFVDMFCENRIFEESGIASLSFINTLSSISPEFPAIDLNSTPDCARLRAYGVNSQYLGNAMS
jgi:hypothetical protein